MKIGLDIDDVLYGWYDRAHQICSRVPGLVPEGLMPVTWTPSKEYGCSHEAWVDALVGAGEELYTAEAFADSAAQCWRIVDRGHQIHYITARSAFGTRGPEIERWTLIWLFENNFPYPGNVHFLTDKTAYWTDYFLDDRTKHVQALQKVGTRARLQNRSWNIGDDVPDKYRVNSVKEFVDEVLSR